MEDNTPFDIDPKKVYTIEEVSKIIRLERQTVQKIVRDGKIPSYKLGDRAYRISGKHLIKFLNDHFMGGE